MKTNTLIFEKQLDNYYDEDFIYNDVEEFFTARLRFMPNGKRLKQSKDEIIADLRSAVNNLYFLNDKSIDKNKIINYYFNQIKNKYIIKINKDEFINIINEIIEECITNYDYLLPSNTTYKEIWVNPLKQNRTEISRSAPKVISINKINNYFDDLINYEYEKITYEKIARTIDLSERTVYTYITEEQKKQMNLRNKLIKLCSEDKYEYEFNENSDLTFLFKTDVPTQPAEPKACPIKQSKVTTVTIRENLTGLFEQYIISNNQGQYEFSDETFSNILNHFNQSEIEWLKSNLNNCIELKKKSKIFDRAKRELLYILFSNEELITDSSIEYKPIDHHRMPQINSNATIEEVEYEDDADEDDDDLENEINENSYSKVKYY